LARFAPSFISISAPFSHRLSILTLCFINFALQSLTSSLFYTQILGKMQFKIFAVLAIAATASAQLSSLTAGIVDGIKSQINNEVQSLIPTNTRSGIVGDLLSSARVCDSSLLHCSRALALHFISYTDCADFSHLGFSKQLRRVQDWYHCFWYNHDGNCYPGCGYEYRCRKLQPGRSNGSRCCCRRWFLGNGCLDCHDRTCCFQYCAMGT